MASADRPEVTTTYGAVRGEREPVHNTAVFRGIPFAAPPFGANRFKVPQPPAKWDGVRDALVVGDAVPQPVVQIDSTGSDYFNPTKTGEDCLNLNVWTPDPGGAGLPVMVWIHGGGYVTGSGGAPIHDGAPFARDGVVYVSINYRMHLDGFVSLPGAPENRGLRDQVAALEWVRDNIAAFGGDPANVTIFGQSAGGVSVMHLLAMPSARGMFRRAIPQSGSTRVTGDTPFMDRVRNRLAEMLGVAATADGFSAVSMAKTLEMVMALGFEFLSPFFWGEESFRVSPYKAMIDGDTVPADIDACLRAGSADGVDVMAGCTRDECTFIMEPFGLLKEVPDFFSDAALSAFGLTASDLDVYKESSPDDALIGWPYGKAWTSWAFREPAARLLDVHAARPGNTFAYEFSWASPTMPQLGSVHALEIPFVYDGLRPFVEQAPPGQNLLGDNPPQELATRMHKAWIDFATHGNPGWSAYDTDTRAFMNFDVTSEQSQDWAALDRSLLSR